MHMSSLLVSVAQWAVLVAALVVTFVGMGFVVNVVSGAAVSRW